MCRLFRIAFENSVQFSLVLLAVLVKRLGKPIRALLDISEAISPMVVMNLTKCRAQHTHTHTECLRVVGSPVGSWHGLPRW